VRRDQLAHLRERRHLGARQSRLGRREAFVEDARVDGLDLGERQLADGPADVGVHRVARPVGPAVAYGAAPQGLVVVEHRHAVRGQPDVQLDHVDADLQCPGEARNGVLRPEPSCTAMPLNLHGDQSRASGPGQLGGGPETSDRWWSLRASFISAR
jgi:hypothetical protein